MGSFSAIIEPFALREAASFGGSEYRKRAQLFAKGLREVLLKNKETEVYFHIHLCFLVDDDVDRLLKLLCDLRKTLLEEGRVVPFSAVVGSNRVEFHKIVESVEDDPDSRWRVPEAVTEGVYCNDVGAMLLGKLTKLKAVAIALEDDVVSQSKKFSTQVVESYYIANYAYGALRSYNELLFRPEDLEPDVRSSILREFRQTTLRSKKLGRFFIPLLVNWCKASPLKPDPPKLGPSLTKLASDHRLGSIRDGVGLEVVYCALLERLSAQDPKLTIAGSKTLFNHLTTQNWLRESARSDTSSSRLANQILTDNAKRWFATTIGGIEVLQAQEAEEAEAKRKAKVTAPKEKIHKALSRRRRKKRKPKKVARL